MTKKIEEFIITIEEEIDRIWLNEPEDVYALKKGYLPSGAGIYGQYYTVLVMLGGEMRALGIHIFADLLEFSKQPEFELHHLQAMAKRMLKIDCGVISYFGLPMYGKHLNQFYRLIDEIKNKEDFAQTVKVMFTYTNRYQMWLHQIFPWNVSMFFKQQSPDTFRDATQKLQQYNDLL